jgi:hypothetical protein
MEDGEVEDSDVFGDRTHHFVPPAWVMFDALTVDLDKWLDLAPGEVRPRILEAERPSRVVWSSFWPVSPNDTVELLLAPDGPGTTLRFIWRSPSPPDERGVAITRQRLNQKLAGDLREWVDTGSRIVREASPARD